MPNPDTLDMLIKEEAQVLIAQNAERFRQANVGLRAPARSLDRRIRRLIARERQKQQYGARFPALKRAAVFAAVCTASLVLILNAGAVRQALTRFFMDFTEDYISITHVTENLPPTTIEQKREPTEVPEGWEKQVDVDNAGMYSVDYFEEDDYVLCYTQMTLGNNISWLDNENTQIQEIKINQFDGYLFHYIDKELYSLEWSDGEYQYSINTFVSTISKETIISIATSVR